MEKGVWTTLKCGSCGTLFSVPQWRLRAAKYCSLKCKQIEGGKKASKVIIRKYRGTGTKTYVKENGRHQHRVVMEKMLGRPLIKGEIVHHKDGNKKNNDPSNLEVMTQSEHCKTHQKMGQFQSHAVFTVKQKCIIEDCSGIRFVKNLCAKHYHRQWKRNRAS